MPIAHVTKGSANPSDNIGNTDGVSESSDQEWFLNFLRQLYREDFQNPSLANSLHKDYNVIKAQGEKESLFKFGSKKYASFENKATKSKILVSKDEIKHHSSNAPEKPFNEQDALDIVRFAAMDKDYLEQGITVHNATREQKLMFSRAVAQVNAELKSTGCKALIMHNDPNPPVIQHELTIEEPNDDFSTQTTGEPPIDYTTTIDRTTTNLNNGRQEPSLHDDNTSQPTYDDIINNEANFSILTDHINTQLHKQLREYGNRFSDFAISAAAENALKKLGVDHDYYTDGSPPNELQDLILMLKQNGTLEDNDLNDDMSLYKLTRAPSFNDENDKLLTEEHLEDLANIVIGAFHDSAYAVQDQYPEKSERKLIAAVNARPHKIQDHIRKFFKDANIDASHENMDLAQQFLTNANVIDRREREKDLYGMTRSHWIGFNRIGFWLDIPGSYEGTTTQVTYTLNQQYHNTPS